MYILYLYKCRRHVHTSSLATYTMTLVWNTELLTQDVNKNQHDVKYAAVLNSWYGCVCTFRAICYHKRIEDDA